MQYALLTDLEPQIVTFTEDQSAQGTSRDEYRCGAFLEIEGRTCCLAFYEDAPHDMEGMAGVMAHKIAHVYRAFHGLVNSSSWEEEERLTDVTAVYLGFGILAANLCGNLETSHADIPYLTPQAFAYLVALQMVARNLSKNERRRILKHLEWDQDDFARVALDSVILIQLYSGKKSSRSVLSCLPRICGARRLRFLRSSSRYPRLRPGILDGRSSGYSKPGGVRTVRLAPLPE